MTYAVGDKIRLTKMDNDPSPIAVGTCGVITDITDLHSMGKQVSVNWENGRTLRLVLPEDEFEVIEKAENQ